MHSLRTMVRPPQTMTPLRCVTLIAAILLWHFLAVLAIDRLLPVGLPPSVVQVLRDLHSSNWLSASSGLFANLAVVCAAGIFFALSYVIWRIECARRTIAAPADWFIYCTAWSCALGTIFLPPLLALIRDAGFAGRLEWPMFLTFALFAPAALAPLLLRARSRWRPVCPECGYSLSRTRAARCSECGEPFPTDRRRYRRWAIQRLPWDRRHRWLPTAYASTLLAILFRPWHSAPRLAHPDRSGRAVRWILGHAALALALVLLLPLIREGIVPMFAPARRAVQIEDFVTLADRSDEVLLYHRVLWHGQWTAAWLLTVVGFPVALCSWLAFAWPGISTAARVGLVKWTLYSAVVPFLVFLFAVCMPEFIVATGIQTRVRMSIITALLRIKIAVDQNPHFYVNASLLLFALAWASGVASLQWLPRRGPIAFGLALLTFLAAWRGAVRLFPLQDLEALL